MIWAHSPRPFAPQQKDGQTHGSGTVGISGRLADYDHNRAADSGAKRGTTGGIAPVSSQVPIRLLSRMKSCIPRGHAFAGSLGEAAGAPTAYLR